MPTASTTAALALGDALAMTLLVAKGFQQEDFANLHPGGKFGKRLMRVEQLMHSGEQTPIVRADTPMPEVIYEMTRKGLGMTCVVDDGDRLRRHHHRRRPAAPHGRRHQPPEPPRLGRHDATSGHRLAGDARRRGAAHPRAAEDHLHRRRGSANLVKGVVHLHDLWRTGMV